jgi:hypothetical protein
MLGIVDAGFVRDVFERAIPAIVKQEIRFARETVGPTEHAYR